MFNSRTRTQYSYYEMKYNPLKKILIISQTFIVVILSSIGFYAYSAPNLEFLSHFKLNYMIGYILVSTCFDIFIFRLENMYKQKKFLQVFLHEQMSMIEHTKMPKAKPKLVLLVVVNEFFNANHFKKQVKSYYENCDIWVCDALIDKNEQKVIERYCLKNNINLFRAGNDKKISHSAAVNRFLKYSGTEYEYICIISNFIILNEKFLESAIKCFYSSKVTNLGYVTSLNYIYRWNTLYSMIMRHTMNYDNFRDIYNGYSLNTMPPVDKHCTLYKREFIMSMNNTIPEGGYWIFATQFASRGDWTGFQLIISPCRVRYDESYAVTEAKKINETYCYMHNYKNLTFLTYNNAYAGNARKQNFRLFFGPFAFLYILFMLVCLIYITEHYVTWETIGQVFDPNDEDFTATMIFLAISFVFLIFASLSSSIFKIKILKWPMNWIFSLFNLFWHFAFFWKNLVSNFAIAFSKKKYNPTKTFIKKRNYDWIYRLVLLLAASAALPFLFLENGVVVEQSWQHVVYSFQTIFLIVFLSFEILVELSYFILLLISAIKIPYSKKNPLSSECVFDFEDLKYDYISNKTYAI